MLASDLATVNQIITHCRKNGVEFAMFTDETSFDTEDEDDEDG